MSEVNNPVLGYADSYRLMARMVDAEGRPRTVEMFSVITDLERNIAPLFTAAQSELAALRVEVEELNKTTGAAMFLTLTSELAALREELRTQTLRADAAVGDANEAEQRLTAAEQRNATLVECLEHMLKDDDMPVHWFAQRIDAALTQPTESGASE